MDKAELRCRTQDLNGQERLACSSLPEDEVGMMASCDLSLTVVVFFRQRIYPVLFFSSSGNA